MVNLTVTLRVNFTQHIPLPSGVRSPDSGIRLLGVAPSSLSLSPETPGKPRDFSVTGCPHLQTRHCCHTGLLGGVRFWWVSRWEVSLGQWLGGARGGTFATDPSHWGAPPHPINVAGTLTHNKPMRESLLVSYCTRENAHAQKG